MPAPIKVTVTTDISGAQSAVSGFADDVEGKVGRIGDSFDDAAKRTKAAGDAMGSGLDRAREGFDAGEQRATGFRDSITGAQDAMAGFAALSKGDAVEGLLLLGSGAADTASGFANFLIPSVQRAIPAIKNLTVVQRLLNITMLTNPVFLVVAALVALGVILVIAYRRSETFRNIVNSAFASVRALASVVFPAVVAFVRGMVTGIGSAVSGIASIVRRAITNPGGLLRDIGRRIIDGLLGGLQDGFARVQALLGRLTGLLPDWKGPPRRDRAILAGAGTMIMVGFRRAMEAQYRDVQSSLTGFTAGLSADAALAPTLLDGAVAGRGGAAASVALEIRSSGSTVDDLLLEWLRGAIRVRGGDTQLVLGPR
jgi:phage-related protein